MPRLIWAEHALTDLLAIEAYFEDRNPAAGARAIRALRDKAQILEDFPEAGPAFQDEIRTLSIGGTPYSLLYRVVPEGIAILRIRHEREDWR